MSLPHRLLTLSAWASQDEQTEADVHEPPQATHEPSWVKGQALGFAHTAPLMRRDLHGWLLLLLPLGRFRLLGEGFPGPLDEGVAALQLVEGVG